MRVMGLSSDTPFPPSKLDLKGLDTVFLPTVSPSSKSEPGRTRVYVARYGGGDYVVVTRPLYMGVEEVLREAEVLKQRGARVAASIVAEKLSGYLSLLSRLGKSVDIVEIDLGLFYALYGLRRGFESYAVDLLEEVIPASSVPLAVKLSPNMPISREFLREVEEVGVNLLVFTTHPVYTVGGQVFRVHSTHLSLIYNHIWAAVASEGLSVKRLLATETPGEGPGEGFLGLLLDTALIMGKLPKIEVKSRLPRTWRRIPPGLLPAIPGSHGYCSQVCPYGAFKGEGELVVAESGKCDMCGLCLSMCQDKVSLVRELKPS